MIEEDMNGIVDLFNEIRYANNSLSTCNAQELLDFVKKCCKVERNFAIQSQKQKIIEEIEKLIKDLRTTDFLFRVDKDTIFTDKYVNAFELKLKELLNSLGEKEQ